MLHNNYQPLDQFEIIFLGYYKNFIPITNATVYMFFTFATIYFFINLTFKGLKIIPGTLQSFFESIYMFVFNLLKQTIGLKGYGYFPLKITLFLFILTANLLGLTLYSFTITSHAVITFSLAFIFFIGIFLIGIVNQKLKFIMTFIPSGAPLMLMPFLVPIEIVSYFSRPISLAIRLFANILSGHALLVILADFTFAFSKKNFLIAAIPFILIVVIIGLEVLVAILQAYVFLVLLTLYLNDSIHGAH